MKYYYLHPFKRQYFFPQGFKNYEVLLGFYKPYTLVGFISWWLFRNCKPYRLLFGQNDIEAYIPERKIMDIVGSKALMAFNQGTVGPEQKITALGIQDGQDFFIKYAESDIAMSNVKNEYQILKILACFRNVPRVLDFYQDDQKVLLKTTVLHGKRMEGADMSYDILNVLYTLNTIEIDITTGESLALKTSFAHGDFCPWNMMRRNGDILIYDWEMAGNYPLGYDLFTFIFQSAFLLSPKKTITAILNEYEVFISTYFSHFRISHWQDYLIGFVKIKIDLEMHKGQHSLLVNYKALLDHVKKT